VKEISAQKLPNSHQDFRPLDMDLDIVRGYKPNQIVRMKIYGVRKPRSVKQLNTYWAVCKTVADNTENPQWNTKKKVDFQCRVKLHFVDPDLVAVKPDGTVVVYYLSIAFPNLGHIMACNYFDRAFEAMASFLSTKETKVSVDQLVDMAKEGMG